MRYSIAALTVAAHRAKDVAALVEAARVLTFMARAKAREPAPPQSVGQIESIYRTASRLAFYGRELAAETNMLVEAAEGAAAEPEAALEGPLEHDIEVLRTLLVASMQDALSAIDTLESIQELGAEELDGAALGTESALEKRRYVDELLGRLRRRR